MDWDGVVVVGGGGYLPFFAILTVGFAVVLLAQCLPSLCVLPWRRVWEGRRRRRSFRGGRVRGFAVRGAARLHGLRIDTGRAWRPGGSATVLGAEGWKFVDPCWTKARSDLLCVM